MVRFKSTPRRAAAAGILLAAVLGASGCASGGGATGRLIEAAGAAEMAQASPSIPITSIERREMRRVYQSMQRQLDERVTARKRPRPVASRPQARPAAKPPPRQAKAPVRTPRADPGDLPPTLIVQHRTAQQPQVTRTASAGARPRLRPAAFRGKRGRGQMVSR
jgi:hypothetical protein